MIVGEAAAILVETISVNEVARALAGACRTLCQDFGSTRTHSPGTSKPGTGTAIAITHEHVGIACARY